MGSGRLRIQLWSDQLWLPRLMQSSGLPPVSVGQEGEGQEDTSSETFEDEGSQLATPPI